MLLGHVVADERGIAQPIAHEQIAALCRRHLTLVAEPQVRESLCAIVQHYAPSPPRARRDIDAVTTQGRARTAEIRLEDRVVRCVETGEAVRRTEVAEMKSFKGRQARTFARSMRSARSAAW